MFVATDPERWCQDGHATADCEPPSRFVRSACSARLHAALRVPALGCSNSPSAIQRTSSRRSEADVERRQQVVPLHLRTHGKTAPPPRSTRSRPSATPPRLMTHNGRKHLPPFVRRESTRVERRSNDSGRPRRALRLEVRGPRSAERASADVPAIRGGCVWVRSPHGERGCASRPVLGATRRRRQFRCRELV